MASDGTAADREALLSAIQANTNLPLDRQPRIAKTIVAHTVQAGDLVALREELAEARSSIRDYQFDEGHHAKCDCVLCRFFAKYPDKEPTDG